jgi:hypothetical protein
VSSQTRHAVYDTLPVVFPEILPGDRAAGLGLPPVSVQARTEIGELVASPGLDGWSEALSRVGNCAHPIRLQGSSVTVDRATGRDRLFVQQQPGAARAYPHPVREPSCD